MSTRDTDLVGEDDDPTSRRLTDLYAGVAVHATADLEHKAALELMALVMLADLDLADAEIEAVREISDDWRDDDWSLEKYLGQAIERVRAAIAAGEVVELLDDIDRRISSRVLRRALFSAAQEVAESDDHIGPVEDSLLAEIAVRFG